MRRPVRAAPFWWMITRYCGLPKLEYQILTSRSFPRRAVFERGDKPTVRAAASLVSNMASETGPVSLAAKLAACCAKDEHGIASRSEAVNVSRLMSGGRVSRTKGHN